MEWFVTKATFLTALLFLLMGGSLWFFFNVVVVMFSDSVLSVLLAIIVFHCALLWPFPFVEWLATKMFPSSRPMSEY